MSLFFGAASASGAESGEISKDKLVEMFDNISKKTKWDLTKPMLRGYFFTNARKNELEKGKLLLVNDEYRFVEIYENGGKWWLHGEKEETHTIDYLFKKMLNFINLRQKIG